MTRSFILAGVALFALGAPAFAQQATGLYVSAGIGANWVGDTHGVDPIPGDPIDWNTSADVGPAGIVAVGYDWGFLRTEAELGIRSNQMDGEWDGGGTTDWDGHIRSITGMANLLVDFDLGPVTIYGGGGLGIGSIEYNQRDTFGSDFDSAWLYQGIAGLEYNISQQLAIGARYTYLASFDDLTFDGLGDFGVHDVEFNNHSVFATLRYTFAAAPAAVVDTIAEKSYLVFFDFDSSQLTPDAQSIVATAAADALAGNSTRLDVTGHTDRSGSDAYNQALSIRRATSVQNALIANGVPADIIVIRGAGENEPLVPTADGVREPQNRRVEIVIN